MSEKPRIKALRDEEGRAIVTCTEDLAQALAAGYGPQQLVLAAPDPTNQTDAIAEAVAAAESRFAAERIAWSEERVRLVQEAIDVTSPEQRAHFAAAERVRIMDIHSLTKPGLQNVAQAAIDGGLSVEAFALAQLREMQDRGVTLDDIRADAPPPAAHAKPSMETEAQTRAHSSWDKVVKRFTEGQAKKG